MRATVEIARVNLLRVVRDRTNLFFVFVLPLIIIIALGAAFGGAGTSRLGVVAAGAGPLGEELVGILESGDIDVAIRDRDSLEQLQLRPAAEAKQLRIDSFMRPGKYTLCRLRMLVCPSRS